MKILVMYKNELARHLGVSANTLAKELLLMEPKLVEINPNYNRRAKMLRGKVLVYILEELCITNDELT